jgi:uncharacterized delta-60 repeat protein
VVVGDGFVSRYLANGSLDATFGVGGRAALPIIGRAVALTADGGIVVAGGGCDASACGFAAARYTATGVLDASFGNGGVAVVDFGGLQATAAAILVDSQGALVLAGAASGDAGSDFALAGLRADGRIDMSFGTGGRVVTDLGGADDAARSLVAAGSDFVAAGTSNGDFALVRYDRKGRPVKGWGESDGVTRTDFAGGVDRAWSIAVDADGRFVVSGNAELSPSKSVAAFARYTGAGLLDPAFGAGGKVTVDLGMPSAVAESVVVLPGGGIAAAGSAADDPHEIALFAFFVLDSSGALDSRFGDGGVATTSFFGGAGIQEARAAVLTSSGVVAAGYAMTSTSGDQATALARYRFRAVLRGDANGDGLVNIADAFALLNYLAAGGPAPQSNSDVNGDGLVDIRDVFYLIDYVYASGPAPVR